MWSWSEAGPRRSAASTAATGLSVVMVEKDKAGSTCLHRRCSPRPRSCWTASVYPGGSPRLVATGSGWARPLWLLAHHRPQGAVIELQTGLLGLIRNSKISVFDGTPVGAGRAVTSWR